MTRTEKIMAEARAADMAYAAWLARPKEIVGSYLKMDKNGDLYAVKAHRRRPKNSFRTYGPRS